MQTWLRHTLSAVLIAGTITGVVFTSRAERSLRPDYLCRKLEVEFADEYRFVNAEDVRDIITARYGNFFGTPVDSLDLLKIEASLDTMTAIVKSQAWTTDDGILHVQITQRKPVVRFMNGETGHYVDETGHVIPLFQRYTAATPVIYGPAPQDSAWVADAIGMVEQMTPYWTDRVDSIGVDVNGYLTLKAGGPEEILFGSPAGAAEKLRKLRNYTDIIRPKGNEYNIIDLTYKDQIICK